MEPPFAPRSRREDTCCVRLHTELNFKPAVSAKWKESFLFLEDQQGPLHILDCKESGIHSRIEHSSCEWNVEGTQGFMEWKVAETNTSLLLVIGANATLTFFEQLPKPSFCLPYQGDGRALNPPGSSHFLCQFNDFLIDMCKTPQNRFCCIVNSIHITKKDGIWCSSIAFVSFLEVESDRLYLNWKDKILFGACENRLVAWSSTLNCIQKNYQHTDFITSMVHCEKNDTVITASKDKTIRIWNPHILACVQVLIDHEEVTNLFEWNGYLASQFSSGIHLRHLNGQLKGKIDTDKLRSSNNLATVMWKNHLITWNEADNQMKVWTGYFEWKQARVILIGWKKNRPEDCHLAKLPRDIIRVILHSIREEN